MAKSKSFLHDTGSRDDIAIKKLIVKHGMTGYGIFWAITEMLYLNDNVMPADYDSIAYDLRVDTGTVHSVINDFGLFELSETGETFGSPVVGEQLAAAKAKSAACSKSVSTRYNKPTNVEQKPTNVENTSTNVGKKVTNVEKKPTAVEKPSENVPPLHRLLTQVEVPKKPKTKPEKADPIQILNEFLNVDKPENKDFVDTWLLLCSQPKWKKKSPSALRHNIKLAHNKGYRPAFLKELMNMAIASDYQGLIFPTTDAVYQKWCKENGIQTGL